MEATPPAQEPEKPKGKIRRIVLGVLLFSAAAYGLRYYIHSLSYQSTDDAFLEGRIVAASPRVSGHVLAVHVGDNQQVKEGDLLVEIDPRDFALRLERARAALKVAESRAGSLSRQVDLTRITSGAGLGEAASGLTRAQAGADTVQAQIEVAKSRIEQASAQRQAAQAATEQAAAQVRVAEAETALSQKELERYDRMNRTGIVSQQQFDQVEMAAKAAAARLDGGRKALDAARAQENQALAAQRAAEETLRQTQSQWAESQAGVGQAKSRLAGAQSAPQQVATRQAEAEAALSQVEQARAEVRQAELDLSYTRLVAPMAGRVTKKSVEQGSYVQAGQALFALVSPELWVVANFKETQLDRIRPGQRAVVRVDAFPDREFSAHVDSIQSGTGSRFSLLPPENATGNFVKVVQRLPVKIVFDEPLPPELPLGPGMSVAPEVYLK